jgi:hypothetical protein
MPDLKLDADAIARTVDLLYMIVHAIHPEAP